MNTVATEAKQRQSKRWQVGGNMEYPKDVVIKTKFGEAVMSVTSSTHVYIESKVAKKPGGGLFVNGLWLNASAHVGLENGKWTIDSQYVFTSRAENLQEGTPNARKKISEEFVRAVSEYLSQHPYLLAQGERTAVASKRKSLLDKIAEKRNELAALEKELHELDSVGAFEEECII